MKRSQRHSAACALVCIVTAGQAAAQKSPAVDATRFEFRAPDGCGSADDFAARVSKRSARIRLVSDSSVRRSLVVEIQQAPGGALNGKVTVIESDGTSRTRPLNASSCDEALDALSLIATVTLDPDAMLAEPPAEQPKAEPGLAPPPAKAQPKPEVRRKPPPFRRAPPRELYRFSFGLEAVALVRMAPEPVFGGGASAAFEMNPSSVGSPFWRLTLAHGQRRDLAAGVGQASFAFSLSTLELCPVRLGPRFFGVRPCAFGTLGLLKAWGSGTLRDETHSRWVGSAGVGVWTAARVSEVFEIIADVRVGLPLRRDRFAFDQVSFFETPSPALALGLGLAGGFP